MMHGILNLNKSQGLTSRTVVSRVQQAFKLKKIGYAGTLDPEATGVLPLCIGKATKTIPFLLECPKTYKATMKLGVMTDTDDASGNVVETSSYTLDKARIEAIVKSFQGEIDQIPPMYSALKYKGRRLYELAREGKVVDRAPRKVTLFQIEVLDICDPFVIFEVTCSRGTYIRTLCRDIGLKSGYGAHLFHLIRTRVGVFDLTQSVSLDQLEKMRREEVEQILWSIADSLSFLPSVIVKEEGETRLSHGLALRAEHLLSQLPSELKERRVKAQNERGECLAIVEIVRKGEKERGDLLLAPLRVFLP
ncbi:MAG: tRNA pseudouridine(55) synthase TruB [Candidatus Tectomicrobia bacterium]|nr:tRNA pseudouridine(55) synthase TruB [Candidatus Tectomicrobia bacterium]